MKLSITKFKVFKVKKNMKRKKKIIKANRKNYQRIFKTNSMNNKK